MEQDQGLRRPLLTPHPLLFLDPGPDLTPGMTGKRLLLLDFLTFPIYPYPTGQSTRRKQGVPLVRGFNLACQKLQSPIVLQRLHTRRSGLCLLPWIGLPSVLSRVFSLGRCLSLLPALGIFKHKALVYILDIDVRLCACETF